MQDINGGFQWVEKIKGGVSEVGREERKLLSEEQILTWMDLK